MATTGEFFATPAEGGLFFGSDTAKALGVTGDGYAGYLASALFGLMASIRGGKINLNGVRSARRCSSLSLGRASPCRTFSEPKKPL